MQINIKFTGTVHDDVLRAYAEEKVHAVAKLLTPTVFDAAICSIELQRDARHQSGDVYHAEVTLEAEGKVYRVRKEEQSFEKALDKVKDDILQELREAKERHEHLLHKGNTRIKEEIRGVE